MHELSQDPPCAAVAIGSSRRAAHGQVLPGLAAERVLQGGRVPVAVAPRGFARKDGPGVQTVGAAFVETAEGRDAVHHAARIARGVVTDLRVLSVVDPLEALTDATADLDLLVVGSRGYGPMRAVLLGGVSAPLMRQAARPVLVVPRVTLPEHDVDGWRTVPARRPRQRA